METTTIPVYNSDGKEVEKIKLDSAVFDGKINKPAIYQMVNAYRANQRKGLACVKDRGAVSGGGRKPWRQKGTGRARAGSNRSPLWRHGGVTFGPKPRDYHYQLPQKIKVLALKSSLNAKVKGDNLILLEGFQLTAPKTKEAAAIIAKLKIDCIHRKPSLLLLLDKVDDNVKRALGNISSLNVLPARDVNAYEILSHQKMIATLPALKELVRRLSPVRNSKRENKKISNGVENE